MSKVHIKGSMCLRRGAFSQTKRELKVTDRKEDVTCRFCIAHIELDKFIPVENRNGSEII